MKKSAYQILPDLLPEEYEALKASIAERGVDIPIIVDDQGNIIDGFHRHRACDELGVFCPREVRQFGSEAEKFELALRANCRRRQLNRKQREKLIEVYLVRDPQIADNSLGKLIGVSKNTVAKVRSHLEATCQIDKFEKLRGRDGKERPVKYKRIIANTPREAEMAMKVIGDLPANCEGKMLDVTTAKRRARRNTKQNEIDQVAAELFDDENIRLFHCRFQELEQVAGITAGSAALVSTDIPYDKGFVVQVSDLAQMASRLLADGGLAFVMTGQLYTDEVERRLREHLVRQTPGIMVWDGDANMIHPIQCASQYKPVLRYSKGKWTPRGRWSDVSRVNCKEKDWHSWQQPLQDAEFWIRQFSKPGDLVVDPCGGGFTMAVACYRLGRRFIGCDCDEKCVVKGLRRLAEERAKRERLLADLMVWIEDSEEMKARRPETNYQRGVQELWSEFSGENMVYFKTYLHLLPDTHRAIWKTLV